MTTSNNGFAEQPGAGVGTLELVRPSDEVVATQFADMVRRIDVEVTAADEALLAAVPQRKVNGTAEHYNMWKA